VVEVSTVLMTQVETEILNPLSKSSLNLKTELWKECPEVYEILRTSKFLEEARKSLYEFLNKLEWRYRSKEVETHLLVQSIAFEAIRTFKNLISKRNEFLSGVSSLEYLWRLARGENEVIEKVDEGFVLEFKHLFKAIMGRPSIYPSFLAEGIEYFDFSKIKGREAGRARSDYLDRLGSRINRWLKRYPSGLDPETIEKRKQNRKRILDFFGASLEDWQDYKWHYKHIFRGKDALEKLEKLIMLTEEEKKAIKMATEYQIPFGITPYYLHLMDYEPHRKYDAAVRAQVIPPIHYVENMAKHRQDREYAMDFMGEHDTSPIDLVTRRYPKVAIIKPYDSCPQICVYCQRNWEITGPLEPGAMPSREVLEAALDWYAEHPQIMDVLITGGEPLVLSDQMLERILERFAEMEHITSIRIASRIVVTLPFRVTDETAEMLGSFYEEGRRFIYYVTHVESAYEITPELVEAVKKLRKQGIYVYNQQVFTQWDSRRFETVALRIALKKAGIDPYYCFYPKGKWEHKDYIVPVARIMQERKEEARLLPGIYRTEEPVFNVPRLGKNHLRSWQDHELIMIRPDGRRVYLWHPWEKNIALVNPYIYTDIVSIKMYLDKLKERGENPEDYQSIWYYY